MHDDLAITGLSAGYGASVVLHDVSFSVAAGETVAILGRNGMGKTTLLETLVGLTTWHGGAITWRDERIEQWPTWRRSRAGIGLVPQEREVFPSLTVEENLRVARRGSDWTAERAFDLFPRLAERRGHRGNQLSGGEQQMLAIARALMGSPRLLLLDEPLEGLAPIVVDALVEALVRLRDGGGLTLLLVEQHALIASELARRTIALVRGRIAYDGPSDELMADQDRLAGLIGVARQVAA